MGGGTQKQTTTGSTTTLLPENQQQNVDLLMQGARDFYNSGGVKFYPGQTYADTTGQQLTARQNAEGYATGAGQDLVNNYQAGENFWLNPANTFNPQNIPGFTAAQDDVTQRVRRELTESMLPGIRGGAIQSNSLGGSRQNLGEGLAVGRASDALAGTLANMNMQAYGQGLNMYNAAAGRAPQTYNMGLAPSQTLSAVGQEYQSDQQRAIDESMQRFNFEQLAPLLNLQALQSLTGTAGQYGGTVNSTQEQKMSGGGGGGLAALGGFLSLLSLAIPGMAPVAGAVNAAGAVSGGGGFGGSGAA